MKRITLLSILFSAVLSFNSFAMTGDSNNPPRRTPLNEVKNEDRTLNYGWSWLSDESCVRFRKNEGVQREQLRESFDRGLLPQWAENGKNGTIIKKRYTYEGKWLQSEAGTWSFEFDDATIPLGLTKIDDVLYAFNGYGELQEGYNYWGDLKTAADGLVTSDDPEFLAWLATQYVPECTSHE